MSIFIGKPSHDQMMGELVDAGLKHYEHITKMFSDEPDTMKLLAQCVMKFATKDGEKATETNIKFARVCVSCCIQNALDALKREGRETQFSLFQLLNVIKVTPIEELGRLGF